MFTDLLTSKPPGDSDILPAWAVSAARDSSTAVYQHNACLKASRGSGGGAKGSTAKDSSEEEEVGRARRRKKGGKAKGGAKGEGGGAPKGG